MSADVAFERRSLPDDLAAVRRVHAPDALVLDVDRDFEILPPAAAEELGLLVDALDPASYPDGWLPPDAPAALARIAGPEFTIGAPDDGTVVRTGQTEPPTVLVTRRAAGTPEDFLDLLIAEALVHAGAGRPENALAHLGGRYRELADALALGPVELYQVAAALFDAWLGLAFRETAAGWADDHPRLHAAWTDAGARLTDRLDGLTDEVATGETSLPAATEFACAAIGHDLALPAPFDALADPAHREHGAAYAVRWATRVFGDVD